MRSVLVFFTFVLVAYAQNNTVDECTNENCKLPNCRCSSTDIPGGLKPHEVPQFVVLSFHDSVTSSNYPTYQSLLFGRKNTNNCGIGANFYVSHEYSDYTFVNELYSQGFEIGLHAISQGSQSYFRDADKDTLTREFVDQRTLISNFAALPAAAIQGLRMPYLQMSGDTSFEMMKDAGFRYDYSMPTISSLNPGLWPYTLDFASTQDCVIEPCPSKSFPGLWVIPMISWLDLGKGACSTVDGCLNQPGDQDADGWFRFIVENFERQYLGNRAPFTFAVREAYVRTKPGLREALTRFLNMINSMRDVFMVNASELLDWVEKPVALGDYIKQSCRTILPGRRCRPVVCRNLASTHSHELFNMNNCISCPRVYPWLGNPLGR